MPDLLRMRGIDKRFGGVHALRSVDFTVYSGEVHALLGENGAGKSTLIKILSGVYAPDAGAIHVDAREVHLSAPRDAQELGIATIYQEGSLYPDLSVLENLFMGSQPRTRFGTLDWTEMRRRAREVFERLDVHIPLKARGGALSRAQTKLVEIARALLRDARIIVMDEPTAALPSDDVERLFGIVRELRAAGVAVVYISHRLEEIFRIADRVTVLRDGARIGTSEVSEVDHDALIQMMVGRNLGALYAHEPHPPGRVLLEVRDLRRAGVFDDVSFDVREGEIVAMAGLVGSGRSEVARAIYGIDDYDDGTVRLAGTPLPTTPWRVVKAGVGLLPEDRTLQGLVLPFPIRHNVTLPILDRVSRGGTLVDARERTIADRFVETLRIRTPSSDLSTDTLSGGNQQKVVLAKWLAAEPKLLILDEPTQGVDVGAKTEIHALIDGLAGEGIGVLLISSDLEEVLGMADRILVMHRGRVAKQLDRGATAEAVMRAATGVRAPATTGSEESAHVR
ncbi:MAG: sugar ABC transporter ATP-binding protein [Trueperaceae bacterium]|nr:sugar ABC transporter ATP-binding protein [Trueperaceae bacterium]